MSILSLLVGLIVLCVVIWAARAIIAATSTPEPLATILLVVIVLVALLIVLSQVSPGIAPGLRLR